MHLCMATRKAACGRGGGTCADAAAALSLRVCARQGQRLQEVVTALQAALHPVAPPRGFAPAAPPAPGAQEAPAAHSAAAAPAHGAAPPAASADSCAAAAPSGRGGSVYEARPQLLLGAPAAGSPQRALAGAHPHSQAPQSTMLSSAPAEGRHCRVPDVVAELLRDLAPTCEALGVRAELVTVSSAAPPPPPPRRPPVGAAAAAAAASAVRAATGAWAAGTGGAAGFADSASGQTTSSRVRAADAVSRRPAAAALLPRPVRPLLAGVRAEGLRAALELLLDSALQRSPRGGRLMVACAEASPGVAVDITDSGDFSTGARMRAALRGGGGGSAAKGHCGGGSQAQEDADVVAGAPALPDSELSGAAAAAAGSGPAGEPGDVSNSLVARGLAGEVETDAALLGALCLSLAPEVQHSRVSCPVWMSLVVQDGR